VESPVSSGALLFEEVLTLGSEKEKYFSLTGEHQGGYKVTVAFEWSGGLFMSGKPESPRVEHRSDDGQLQILATDANVDLTRNPLTGDVALVVRSAGETNSEVLSSLPLSE